MWALLLLIGFLLLPDILLDFLLLLDWIEAWTLLPLIRFLSILRRAKEVKYPGSIPAFLKTPVRALFPSLNIKTAPAAAQFKESLPEEIDFWHLAQIRRLMDSQLFWVNPPSNHHSWKRLLSLMVHRSGCPPCQSNQKTLTSPKENSFNAVFLRYVWQLQKLPAECVCRSKFNVDHALCCKVGGFVTLRHNELVNLTADLLSSVCKGVSKEPELQPSPIKCDELRADVCARGFWQRMQRAFVDVRVFYPFAPSYRNQTLTTTMKAMESIKKINTAIES